MSELQDLENDSITTSPAPWGNAYGTIITYMAMGQKVKPFPFTNRLIF